MDCWTALFGVLSQKPAHGKVAIALERQQRQSFTTLMLTDTRLSQPLVIPAALVTESLWRSYQTMTTRIRAQFPFAISHHEFSPITRIYEARPLVGLSG
jgi:hypothetical protein